MIKKASALTELAPGNHIGWYCIPMQPAMLARVLALAMKRPEFVDGKPRSLSSKPTALFEEFATSQLHLKKSKRGCQI